MDKAPRPDRKADLAAAALRCLQRDGYAALTARKIAAESGMALGLITYHYASMDALLAAAYALASDQLRRATTQHLSGQHSPLARLDAFLRASFTREFLSPPNLRMRIDLWSAALTNPAIAETERLLYSRYRDELIHHLTALAAQSSKIPAVADLIIATLDGLWLDFMRRGDAAAVHRVLDACLTLTMTLLA